MVSPNIQELGLSDKLLEHYRKEVGEMAVGILDDKPFVSPIHEGILLHCMLELLPYDDSDKSEFSQERFHSCMSKLNDEIIEERRRAEPPEPELPNQTLIQIQQTLGQVAGQLKELQSSVMGISRTVQRHEEILNSHGATDQSRVKDRSFECPDPKYTSLQTCLGSQLAASPGSGVARLIFFGPPTTLLTPILHVQ
jgi:hypothetical protein